MKKLPLMIMIALLAGCTYEGTTLRDVFEDPRSLIKDSHFTDYKEKRDALESQYLSKEITYVEYVEKMNELDNKYSGEVKERNDKIAE